MKFLHQQLHEWDEFVCTSIYNQYADALFAYGLFGHIDRVAGNQFALQRKTQDINAASKYPRHLHFEIIYKRL